MTKIVLKTSNLYSNLFNTHYFILKCIKYNIMKRLQYTWEEGKPRVMSYVCCWVRVLNRISLYKQYIQCWLMRSFGFFLIFFFWFFSGCTRLCQYTWFDWATSLQMPILSEKEKKMNFFFIKWDTTELSELRQSVFGWTGWPAAVCKTWENVLICPDAKVNANKQTACQPRDSSLYLTLDRLLEFIYLF